MLMICLGGKILKELEVYWTIDLYLDNKNIKLGKRI